MHFMVVILSTPNSSIWTTKSSGFGMSHIDFNQRKWVRNRVWRRSFLNNQSLLPVYKSSFQIAAIFENLFKDFNRDFIRFQILKNFTVQLSRLRFTTADEWDGKGDIVRDAAIFREFRGFKNYPWSNNCTNPIRRISSAKYNSLWYDFWRKWPNFDDLGCLSNTFIEFLIVRKADIK